MKTEITLNDLLGLDDLSNVKIRLNLSNGSNDALGMFHNDKERLLVSTFYNSRSKKWFHEGEIVIGLAQIEGNKWLLFDISKITKDHDRLWFDNAGLYDFYDHEPLAEYEKFFGRTIIEFHKDNAYVTVKAEKAIDRFIVKEILPDIHDEKDIFPGYENIDLSWHDLKRVTNKKDWIVALENQKGVYLVTDTKTNKRYVGSAYGDRMLLGRWRHYADNGHGGNVELKALVEKEGFDYVKDNFRYSILDIYKSTTDDKIIINRESRWKEVLLSRKFGYNAN